MKYYGAYGAFGLESICVPVKWHGTYVDVQHIGAGSESTRITRNTLNKMKEMTEAEVATWVRGRIIGATSEISSLTSEIGFQTQRINNFAQELSKLEAIQ